MNTKKTPESQRTRWFMFVLSALALSLPWWLTEFPPIADFAQQLAQIRLFFEMHSGAGTNYVVHWVQPNKLIYMAMAFFWKTVPIRWLGRATMLFLVIVWAGSHHWVAWKRKLPSASATLACLFLYGTSLYWGYLSFLIGWPIFLLWFDWTTQTPETDHKTRTWLTGLLLGWLLYEAHALWFAAGIIWLPIAYLLTRRTWKEMFLQATSLIPTGILAILWQIQHQTTQYAKGGAFWDLSFLEKLSPHWLRLFGMGHLETNVVIGLFWGLILVWVGSALYAWKTPESWERKKQLPFLVLGFFFLAFYLLFPRKYNETISFNRRWLFASFSMLCFALPQFQGHLKKLFRALAVGILFTFCIHTANAWYHFETNALQGLKQALAKLPQNKKLMGLDFVKYHKNFTGTQYKRHLEIRPYRHTYAFAQVYKGGTLNFSFAAFPTLLVQYKKLTPPRWVPDLPSHAEHIFFRNGRRLSIHVPSILQFDFLLIHGNKRIHRIFGSLPFLKRKSPSLPWQLYQVVIPKRKRKKNP